MWDAIAPGFVNQTRSLCAIICSIARRNADGPDSKAAIMKEMLGLWRGLARKHGVQLPDERIDALLRDDAELNSQGLVVWLERQKRAA